MDDFEIIKPYVDEWQSVKDLRTRALIDSPKAYGEIPAENEALSEDQWKDRLLKQTYTCARTISSRKLVGMVAIVREENVKSQHIAEIKGVFVIPEIRGKGVARALLNYAMNEAIEKYPDLVKFKLCVSVSQPEALALYKSLGFEELGVLQKELFVDGEFVDEIEMFKMLK